MKKRNIIISLILCVSYFGIVQVSDSEIVSDKVIGSKKHGVGVASGDVTGVGVSYRYRASKFGVQCTVGGSSGGNLSLGFLYTLAQTQKTNLYVYQGSTYFASKKRYINRGYEEWDTGLGLGIEFIIAKRIALSLITSYVYFTNNDIKKVELSSALELRYVF